MNENRNGIEIDLRRIFMVLLTRAWLIFLVAVVIGAAGFSYAKFGVAPTYSASAQFYVNNNYYDDPGYSSSQLEAANKLADTYIVILRSRGILNEVKALTEGNIADEAQYRAQYQITDDLANYRTTRSYTVADLKSMITAATVNETEIFQVTVTCRNSGDAARIANAIAVVLPAKSPEIVPGSTMTVVDYAQENPNKVGPSFAKYALIGAVIGGLFTAAVLVVLELMDTTIHSEEFLDVMYKDYPLLAVVPGAEGSKNGYYKGYYRGYYAAEKKPAEKKSAPNQAPKKSGGEQ